MSDLKTYWKKLHANFYRLVVRAPTTNWIDMTTCVHNSLPSRKDQKTFCVLQSTLNITITIGPLVSINHMDVVFGIILQDKFASSLKQDRYSFLL